jgi:hypothetical protein
MGIYQVFLISFLTAVLVLAVGGLIVWSAMPSRSGAWVGMRHGPGMMGCGWTEKSHLDALAGFVAGSLDLDDAQRGAFDEVVARLEDTRREVATRCEGFAHPERADVALEVAEDWFDLASSAVRDMRPAFDAFYATLSAEQRAELDGWVAHHDRDWRRR